MIRETRQDDSEAILTMLQTSGQFDERGLAHVNETLNSYLAGESEALWFTADDGKPVGVAYCAPEPITDGTWNLLMLWTRQDRSGQGHGTALIDRVERVLSEQCARLLIVETSGLPDFEMARAFYSKCGFTQEARIQEFFAAGDDKIVFTKRLASNDNAA